MCRAFRHCACTLRPKLASSPRRLAPLRPRSDQHPLLAAQPDHHRQRGEAQNRVDLSAPYRSRAKPRGPRRRNRRLFPGDPHRRERSDVHYCGKSDSGARPQYWKGDLEVRSRRRESFLARRHVLARRYRQSAAHHLYRRTPHDRTQRAHGQDRSGFRQGRRSGPGGSLQLASDHLQEHAAGRRERARTTCHGPARRYARLRRPHGRQEMGVSFRPEAWRARPRILDGGRMEGSHRSQQLGLLHDRGRENRHPVHHLRESGERFLWIRSAG